MSGLPLSASLVTLTLSNDPVASDIVPATWASKSMPLPTLWGRLSRGA